MAIDTNCSTATTAICHATADVNQRRIIFIITIIIVVVIVDEQYVDR